MPGRGSAMSSPWRGRPRRSILHGGSRDRSRGGSQRGSWGGQRGESRTGSDVSSRGSSYTPRRSRGSSAHAYRGSRGSSSVVGPHHTSPIFSSPRRTRVPSLEEISPSAGQYIEDSGYQNHLVHSANRLTLPSNNYFLPSIAAEVEFDNRQMLSSSEYEASSLLGREGMAQVERRNEVLMAISVQVKGVLGCAYYDTDENSLFLLQDMSCTAPLQFVEMLMLHIQPTTVLLPLKVPDVILHFFEQYQSNMDRGSERDNYILRLLGSTEFSHAAAMERLTNLPIAASEHALVTNTGFGLSSRSLQGPGEECQDVKTMRLGSFVDLESVASIGCAGAVLCETIRLQNAQRAAENIDRAFGVSLRMFALADFMFVNADTLSSLQVFQSELHPSNLISGTGKAVSGSKESLSLFGIFHPFAGTPQGKARLKQLFLRPLVNIDMIRERQATIAVFLQPGNEEAFSSISQGLRKVTDIKKTLAQLQRGAAESPAGWASIERDAILQLRNSNGLVIIQKVSHGSNSSDEARTDSVNQMVQVVAVDKLTAIIDLVGKVVDFEETKANSRIAVKLHVNTELDKLKQTYQGLESLLNEVSTTLSLELPTWARKFVTGCVFWPQLGFLTVVPLLEGTQAGYEGQGLSGDHWEQRFTANDNVYFKNNLMMDLDDHFGDTYSRIVDLEVDILHGLACKILEHEATLSRVSDVCGELDCLVALASGALKYGWICPTMTEDNIVSIYGGRHPLQELVVPAFIPNDCILIGGSADEAKTPTSMPDNNNIGISTLIITGPNHSGKSVYVRQVALIVYLAHIGSFVPATGATIGLTDQILTRISTRESVSQAESTFGTDLRQVAFLLNRATRRTLVAIDEFGKGTAADDGAGLMTALIDHFSTLGLQSPKVLITTHYHEIFEGGYLQERPRLSLAHMEVRLDIDANQMEDQVIFLYSLVPGRSTSSFGSRCAALNGIDTAVVERAEAIVLLLARNEDLGVVCARLDATDEARLEEAENVARQFLRISLDGPGNPQSRGRGTLSTLGILESLLVPAMVE
ncbi:MutS domain V [Colletotrichum paranaense]|uniref:MutS domain V n=1 Tax=Colletotrichum paranaense TaxID=1914294 RepID=A0ABQ9SQ36_9PEZI|nr:MutS domain V [Colletotrichum paranaense]KAK1541622.1 MutS domain V [Colletotrichum paranaense]